MFFFVLCSSIHSSAFSLANLFLKHTHTQHTPKLSINSTHSNFNQKTAMSFFAARLINWFKVSPDVKKSIDEIPQKSEMNNKKKDHKFLVMVTDTKKMTLVGARTRVIAYRWRPKKRCLEFGVAVFKETGDVEDVFSLTKLSKEASVICDVTPIRLIFPRRDIRLFKSGDIIHILKKASFLAKRPSEGKCERIYKVTLFDRTTGPTYFCGTRVSFPRVKLDEVDRQTLQDAKKAWKVKCREIVRKREIAAQKRLQDEENLATIEKRKSLYVF